MQSQRAKVFLWHKLCALLSANFLPLTTPLTTRRRSYWKRKQLNAVMFPGAVEIVFSRMKFDSGVAQMAQAPWKEMRAAHCEIEFVNELPRSRCLKPCHWHYVRSSYLLVAPRRLICTGRTPCSENLGTSSQTCSQRFLPPLGNRHWE